MLFYEPPERYKPTSVYRDAVRPLLSPMWRAIPGPHWTQVMSPNPSHPLQGWKIHISTHPDAAIRTLEVVTPICIQQDVEFKFASDPSILKKLNSKTYHRGGGGKFITIYPKNEASFQSTLDTLYVALSGFEGPYILSDRRYKDSRVIFYRYGGFHSFSKTTPTGARIHCIIDNDFSFMEDLRQAFFSTPTFIQDPFEVPIPLDDEVSSGFCNGKYDIVSCIKTSNAGGVYRGKNKSTGVDVIIKEARPYIYQDREVVENLKKEFRILQKISGSAIAPEPYDLFCEWEHTFLAQEYIQGENLHTFIARRNKFICFDSTPSEIKDWIYTLRTLTKNLIKTVHILHGHGIVFGDLSRGNVIIDPETLVIRLIDFEGARDPDIDHPINIFTPGFGRRARSEKDRADFSDDIFAMGCLLASLALPITAFLDIKPETVNVLFGELKKDFGFPDLLSEIILNLLSEIPRPLSHHILTLESTEPRLVLTWTPSKPSQIHPNQITQQVLGFNASVMEPDSHDRLFPAGPDLVHPTSVNHGEFGVSRGWRITSEPFPEVARAWILNRLDPSNSPAGLFNGLSGIAWTLLDGGEVKEARSAHHYAKMHRQLYQNFSMGTGMAGYGLTSLHFWCSLQESSYLQDAIEIADLLCESKHETNNGFTWDEPHGEYGVAVGLHEGSSGIAMFLLYMYCATKNKAYLEVGEGALRFDLSHGVLTDSGSLQFPAMTQGSSILYPYLENGSAGVGTALVRYFAITKRNEYLEAAEKIKLAVSQKYSVSCGLFRGLAGLGNYMLDAAEFLKDPSYLQLVERTFEGVRMFEVTRDQHLAFPGMNLTMLDTSYAHGSTGVALFVHRLVNGGPNFHFTLDQLIHALENGPMEVEKAAFMLNGVG